MQDEDEQYHITEGDITAVIEHMRLNQHKEVTREQAFKILQRVYARQKTLEQLDPKALEEELQDLEEY